MRQNNCYLLCFDVRQQALNRELDWPDERRQTYLFRPDIKFPVSTDRHVLDTLDSRYYDADTFPYTGPFSPFWENLAELQLFLDALKLNAKNYWLMAISIDSSLLTQSDFKYWNKLLGNKSQALLKARLFEGLATPNAVDEGWEFLGYDVADTGFTSALSNMGFTDDDNLPNLRAQWGGVLNTHHLFNKTDDAVQFKEFSNLRAPEYAPFYIFGLWCK